MNDWKLLYLKFKKHMPTVELLKEYPQDSRRIAEAALLDIEEKLCGELIKSPRSLRRLRELRAKYRKIQWLPGLAPARSHSPAFGMPLSDFSDALYDFCNSFKKSLQVFRPSNKLDKSFNRKDLR